MSKIQRSYARIMWRNNEILGLQMINTEGHQFFIYAAPLLTLVDNQGEYVRIKRRDNTPSKYSDHHPGEIYGIIKEIRDPDYVSEESEPVPKKHLYYQLTLYFGTAERKIRLVSFGNKLMEVVGTHRFIFPRLEFNKFIGTLKAMTSQSLIYQQLSQKCDIVCIKSLFDEEDQNEPLNDKDLESSPADSAKGLKHTDHGIAPQKRKKPLSARANERTKKN